MGPEVLKGARVLVTGATGFVGSRVAAALSRAGCELHLLVRAGADGRRLGALWERAARHVGDLEDMDSLKACARAARAAFVFHLAKGRGWGFEREVAATIRLAGALRAEGKGLKRWIRTAHAAPEGAGRGADARLAATLGERYGLSVVTLELYQVYGPGDHEDRLLPGLARAALEGRALPKLSGWKDFVFVDDAAEAYLRAAEAGEAAAGQTFAVGSGTLVCEGEAAAILLKHLGLPAARVRPGPARGHAADTATSAAVLGWRPRVTLKEGLAAVAREAREAVSR